MPLQKPSELPRRSWRNDLVDFGKERSEARAVEHPGRRVPDFLHGEVDAAHGFVPAVSAGHVGSLAGAGNGCEGPIKHANNLTQVNLGGITREEVATSFSL